MRILISTLLLLAAALVNTPAWAVDAPTYRHGGVSDSAIGVFCLDLAGNYTGCGGAGAGGASAGPTVTTPSTCVVTPTTVTGTSGVLVAINANRKSLRWMNVGAADITVAPGTTSPTVGQGMVYAATGAGRQGGSEVFNDPAVATNAFSFSAAASATIAVWECQ